MNKQVNMPEVIKKFDEILDRGLCVGIGNLDGQMCIEAAISCAMGLPFGDDPECVAPAVRSYKIKLNDSYVWSSSASRAAGLRKLGIAQIGSRGVVDEQEFARRLAEKTIRVLIPAIFRDVFKNVPECLAAADRCEKEGSEVAAVAASSLAAEKYLLLSAELALEVLQELKSPGCEWL